MSEIETLAKAVNDALGYDTECAEGMISAQAVIAAIKKPTEAQWGGLARQIIFWMDMQPKTPRALFKHLERSGWEIPQWLRDEPEMKHMDHTVSKGTRAVLVYRAMIDAIERGDFGAGEG
jgi:hypothetical protein